MRTGAKMKDNQLSEESLRENGCVYCDDKLANNPFKYGYAERVRSYLTPWRFVHRVPHHINKSNWVASWPDVYYTRERCTND